MLVIKIEMWPFGDSESAREIGRTYIANVGGTADRGDYEVAVCRRGTTKLPKPIDPDGPKPTRQGEVKDYPRLSYNVWRLIARALLSAFPEEAGKSPPLDVITKSDRELDICRCGEVLDRGAKGHYPTNMCNGSPKPECSAMLEASRHARAELDALRALPRSCRRCGGSGTIDRGPPAGDGPCPNCKNDPHRCVGTSGCAAWDCDKL